MQRFNDCQRFNDHGVYFRVELCGITGHKQLARGRRHSHQTPEAVAVAAAMIRVFIEHGDRTDRKKARLKYLVDKWGMEKFLAETQKKLAFPLVTFPPGTLRAAPAGPDATATSACIARNKWGRITSASSFRSA